MCVVVAYQEMLEMEMLSSNFIVILERSRAIYFALQRKDIVSLLRLRSR